MVSINGLFKKCIAQSDIAHTPRGVLQFLFAIEGQELWIDGCCKNI